MIDAAAGDGVSTEPAPGLREPCPGRKRQHPRAAAFETPNSLAGRAAAEEEAGRPRGGARVTPSARGRLLPAAAFPLATPLVPVTKPHRTPSRPVGRQPGPQQLPSQRNHLFLNNGKITLGTVSSFTLVPLMRAL